MTGEVKIYAKDSVLDGHLECNGQAVSRTTYSDLFALIGTTFGVGDGSTTFNVPDLGGKLIVGYDSGDANYDTLAKTGGSKTADLEHSHTMDAHTHTGSAVGAAATQFLTDFDKAQSGVSHPSHTHTQNSPTVGGQSTGATGNALSTTQSIMNKFVTVLYLIET